MMVENFYVSDLKSLLLRASLNISKLRQNNESN